MAPVWQNEGTNEGTLAVMDNYQEVQYGLDPEEAAWGKKLVLWHGDVKTVLRIRSVQAMRSMTGLRPYDRKEWIMPVLGLWHLRFNTLKLIHRIHWGGSSPIDQSTLQFAADKWERSDVKDANDFRKLEDLLIHSYQSRIIGQLLHLSGRTFLRVEDAREWLCGMTNDELERNIKNTVDSFKSIEVYGAGENVPSNMLWYNHQCFIQHMDIYLLLRNAIKKGDIGLLRCALRELCILFQAKEGRCTNYRLELLRLLHSCDSKAASNRLQNAILCSSIVNLAGRDGKTFEVDRLVEFLNNLVSTAKKSRLSSTKKMEDLLRQITLTAPYQLRVKTILEQTFGRRYPGRHPPKQASEDIWLMALEVARTTFPVGTTDNFSAFPAVNLRQSGLDSLGENIQTYNTNIERHLPSNDEYNQAEGREENEGPALPRTDQTVDDIFEGLIAEIY